MPTPSPRVSVILPTYNQATYLGQAIQSVLAQTFLDWELIIVDDGSTDGTSQCVAQFTDSRVRYYFQSNQERSRARNRGLSEAHGDLIAFLDGDDFWLPDYLEVQMAALDLNPQVGLSYTWHYDTNAAGQLVELRGYGQPGIQDREIFLKALLFGNRMHIGSVIVRTSAIARTGGFDPEINHVEDWDLWLRIALLDPVFVIAKPLTCYRRYNIFMPERLIKRQADEGTIRVVEKAFATLEGSSLSELQAEALARAHWNSAWLRFATRDFEMGCARMTLANNLYPALFDSPYVSFIESIGYLADELYDFQTPLEAALACINQLFDNLPEGLHSLVSLRHLAWGQYCGLHVFRSQQAGDRQGLLWAGALAVRYKPSWLQNRGFVAILGRALISTKLTPPLIIAG